MENDECHGGDIDVLDVNKPGIFTKPIKCVKLLCGNITDALIDSGSDVNLIRLDFYEEIGSPVCNSECVITLTGLGLSKITPIGQFRTSIEIDGYQYRDVVFYVIPKDTIPFKVLIGHEFLQNVITVMKGGSVWMKPNDWLRDVDCCACSVDVVGHVMDRNVREEVVRLVDTYHPQQIKEAPIEVKIILKDEIPVAQRPRRIAPREQAEVDKQINKKMVKDEYPLPIIDAHIDKLADARVFSALDLKNGFFHLRVSEESTKYTSFVTMRRKEDVEILNLLMQEERDGFMEDREELRKSAKRQILKIQEENKRSFKKRKQSRKYKEGELVAVKRTQFGPGLKLKPKFLGPYKVAKVKMK